MSASEKKNILRKILGKSISKGSEELFYCPSCKHHKPKLSINIEKNVFKCWVCDYSSNNIRRLVRRFGNFLELSRWDEFTQEVDISVSLYEKLFPKKGEQNYAEETVEMPKEFISLANKQIPMTALSAKKFLRDRGITQQDIVRWKIGFCNDGPYAGRVVVPSFGLSGKLNYFVARSYESHFNKYKNPPASKDIVFNNLYVDWDNDLCLVEGVFDAIVAGNAVPLLGSTLSERSALFKEILKNDTPVFLALDSDAEKKAIKLVKSLLKYGLEVYKIDIKPYKDVGSMTKQDFSLRKNAAVVMNHDNLIHYQLENL